MSLKLRAASRTDVGKQREQNEDTPYTFISEEQERGLFIVADGMGGYRAGEVASRIAVEKISEAFKSYFVPIADQPTIRLTPISAQETVILEPGKEGSPPAQEHKTKKLGETPQVQHIETQLKSAIRQANRAILHYGEEQSGARGLGCTVTSAYIEEGQAYIANIGDSRTYLFRGGQLTVLTRDHSLVQRLVEEKQIEPDDVYTHPQRNLIYRSLGAGHKNVDPDVFHQKLQAGDTLLLCSDGLWEMVRSQAIENVLKQERDPQKICDILIDLANTNGGEDNITAIVVQVMQ